MVQITRFERARLITARALQLSFGAPPLIKASADSTSYTLASQELEKGVLPLTVMRYYPNGSVEKIAV